MEAIGVAVFDGIAHGGDILQAHQPAIVGVANHQFLIILGGAQAFIGAHLPANIVLFQNAQRALHIGVADGIAHFIQRYAVIGERIGVELDAHGRQRCTVDSHLAYAFYLREFLREYGGGSVIECTGGKVGRAERQRHNRRLRRTDFAIAGVAGHARWQLTARRIERGLNIAHGRIQVAVEGKFHPDKRTALSGVGVDRCHAGNTAKRPLQWGSDCRRHTLRAGAGQTGIDLHRGEIHLRQRRYRQHTPGQQAEQHYAYRQERRGNRSFNKRFCKIHACASSEMFSSAGFCTQRSKNKYTTGVVNRVST